MITNVNGNLLAFPNLTIIGHQTNCLGVMGAGIARQIKESYPSIFNEYHRLCEEKNMGKDLLGECQVCKINDIEETKFVANLFGEYSFKEAIATYPNKRHTDYDALKLSLLKLKLWCLKFIDLNPSYNRLNIGLPHKIGCGLAGGDWDNVVYPMIDEIFNNEMAINLHIVKFNHNNILRNQ